MLIEWAWMWSLKQRPTIMNYIEYIERMIKDWTEPQIYEEDKMGWEKGEGWESMELILEKKTCLRNKRQIMKQFMDMVEERIICKHKNVWISRVNSVGIN